MFLPYFFFFFFNDTATTEIYPLSLHDALPISSYGAQRHAEGGIQRLFARKVQAGRMERCLPLPPFDSVLKCDSPDQLHVVHTRVWRLMVPLRDIRAHN